MIIIYTMSIEDKEIIKKLERELKVLKSASSQWKNIHTLLQQTNKKLFETEEKLNIALEKANIANKAKSIFLASMSHEIRTPMNGIVGMVEIMKQTNIDNEQADFLDIIGISADTLLFLLNDILDFSKIEADKITLECIRLDLDKILTTVTEIVRKQANDKGIELIIYIDHKLPSIYLGDPVRLQQVILNLLSNAIKFTEEGEVFIEILKVGETDNKINIKFSIKDTGIGISNENQEKLFKAFSQAESSTTRRYGGTGLGLAISKKLTEYMGGNIGVKSVAGKGSEFFFDIWIKKSDEQIKTIEKSSRKNLNILCIDDNKTNLRVLKEHLKYFGYKCHLLNKPDLAMEFLENSEKTNPINLILMDYEMPNLNGWQLSSKIWENKKLSNKKIILVSSSPVMEVNHEVVDEKFDAVLTKPLRQQTLFKTIENILGKNSEQDIKYSTEVLPEIRNLKVLLIDDNAINLKVGEMLLSKIVSDIDCFNNGYDAIEKAKITKYDIIFTDIQMPEIDGIETCKKIRETNLNKKTPTIALSANVVPTETKRFLAAGMNDFIGKPYKMQDLVVIIKKYLGD